MKENRPFLAQTDFARSLRRHQTRTEAFVWSLVRRHQMFGLKFRRQHPIGGLVVDFYCHELRLVIELEGDYHEGLEERRFDWERTELLRELGYHVVRLRNEDATRDSLRRTIASVRDTVLGRSRSCQTS